MKNNEVETVHDTPADIHNKSCAGLTTEKGGGNEEGEAAERSFYGHTVHLQIPMPVSCWWGGVRSEFENLGTGTGKVIVFLFSLHINT